MTEVNIPEEAWTAALPSDEDIRRANGIPAAIRVLAEETVRAAATLIVVAELDQQEPDRATLRKMLTEAESGRVDPFTFFGAVERYLNGVDARASALRGDQR